MNERNSTNTDDTLEFLDAIIYSKVPLFVDSNFTITGYRTVSITEFGYVTGVTSSIQTQLNNITGITSAMQTQLNNKQETITSAVSNLTTTSLTINKALISDANGMIATSSVSNTELRDLSGATHNIPSQLETNKQWIAVASNYFMLSAVGGDGFFTNTDE